MTTELPEKAVESTAHGPSADGAAWQNLSYRHPFRKYQALALEAFERADRRSGRFHVVAPPGSGKTVLGLELVRRLARPTLVLCPNTAIQGQWRRQLADFLSPGQTWPAGFVSTDARAPAPLTILTYQALCNLSDPDSLLDEAAVALWRRDQRESLRLTDEEAIAEEERLRTSRPDAFAREVAAYASRLKRDLAARQNGPRLIDLLHPNARALVATLHEGGYHTVVLDECHHLFSIWGYVVRDLVRTLGDDTLVVGLTSTPPADLSGDERELYHGLLGDPSFQVPTPAVVREGHLAPYQELSYFVSPLPVELDFVASRHTLFQELITRVLDAGFASLSLTEWVIRRARERESGPEATTGDGGARVSFGAFQRRHPTLARAMVRFLHQGGHPLPRDVHLNEQLRLQPDVDDWVALLEDYCLRCLRRSAVERDAAALREIRKALVGLGYVLTRTGVRAYVSPVDRVLALSAAKEIAAADILRHEHDALGTSLRALVICDYERVTAPQRDDLEAVLDRQAGSALRVLAHLVGDSFTAPLAPILLTGSGVYCGERTAERLAKWISERALAGAAGLAWQIEERVAPSLGDERVVRVEPPGGWRTADYLPIVTACFQDGLSQCLVGTRSLLGEGWDAPRANTLVDLTTATTHTSMHQIRGRTLRLDPAWREKVANNWDVVCVADLPKGGSDYRRFVRKHRHYYGLTVDGTVESGVTHVHPALSPYAPPASSDLARLNRELLRRGARRQEVRQEWRVGVGYENVEVPTARVRWSRNLGLGRARHRQELGAPRPERLGLELTGQLGLAAGAATTAALLGLSPVWALVLAVALGAALGGRLLARLGSSFAAIPSHLALDGCARAVLGALREEGLVPNDAAASVEITPSADGYYRAYLTGVPPEASRLFAECVADLLAPVENQRYLIPRYWAEPPNSRLGQALFVWRSLLGGAGLYRLQYHPIPDHFATNRKRALLFARHWNRFVSPGEPIYAYSEGAQQLVSAERDRNPFGVLCQLRSIWR